MQDVKPASSAGHTVLDQMECEDLCTATEKCNAASYYLDGTSYGGMNCWLKIIADSCELPADADNDPNAVLLLKIDATCAPLPQPITHAQSVVITYFSLCLTREFEQNEIMSWSANKWSC
jgi:hypothetical protein